MLFSNFEKQLVSIFVFFHITDSHSVIMLLLLFQFCFPSLFLKFLFRFVVVVAAEFHLWKHESLRRFPYFLPCLLVSAFAFASAIACIWLPVSISVHHSHISTLFNFYYFYSKHFFFLNISMITYLIYILIYVWNL